MALPVLASIGIFLQVFMSSSYALKCHEGFNMSFNGIPLYYWTQRECTGNSKCIGQEFAVDVTLADKSVRTAMRYGACVSNAYANYLDCQNLFGSGSTFDPANLLRMIPGIADAVNLTVMEFSKDVSTSLKKLLSDGTGITAFVDGVFAFYKNVGFNLEKAVPLKPNLVHFLTEIIELIDGKRPNASFTNLINTIAQLDTKNEEFSGNIRSLLTNLNIPAAWLADPATTAMIDRLPGLGRSIFPSSWHVELWYDVAFKLTGNINPADWTKTAADMVSTIKASYQIPDEVGRYVNPVLDAMPALARGLQTDPTYVGFWSVELLKTFSEEDASTRAFKTALEGFVGKLTASSLQYEYSATIQWIPGLFYKFFPGDKATIQEVYRKMADGLNSFDFNDLASTADETALSGMIKNMITTLGGQQSFAASPFYNTLVVNVAKMLYDLMKVTPTDYTPYIDSFSKVLNDEFKKYPAINVGGMITELITQMGGTVPNELRPMLTSLQPLVSMLISAANTRALNGTDVINACYEVISSYKTTYPESPFPDLVKRYIDVVYQMATFTVYMFPVNYTYPGGYVYRSYNYTKAGEEYRKLEFQLIFWIIDMNFAVLKAFDYSSNELYQMLIKAWPDYDLYIRILKAMDPEDVKQLIKDIVTWAASSPPHTIQGFLSVTEPVFRNVTSSIKSLWSEARQIYAPNSCRFGSCSDDLCNTQQYISLKQEFTKATPAPPTTTSNSRQPTAGLIYHTILFGMASKLLL